MSISTGASMSSRTTASFARLKFDLLVGDASKAGRQLGWEPTVTFAELARLMVDADLEYWERHAGLESKNPA